MSRRLAVAFLLHFAEPKRDDDSACCYWSDYGVALGASRTVAGVMMFVVSVFADREAKCGRHLPKKHGADCDCRWLATETDDSPRRGIQLLATAVVATQSATSCTKLPQS